MLGATDENPLTVWPSRRMGSRIGGMLLFSCEVVKMFVSTRDCTAYRERLWSCDMGMEVRVVVV